MSNTRVSGPTVAAVIAATILVVTGSIASAERVQARSGSLRATFAAAAREFRVPQQLLLSVAYNESRWEHHGGQPSTTGGYGPMHLVDIPLSAIPAGKGEGQPRAQRPPSLRTLPTAAALLRLPPQVLKSDPTANIRGGAALLERYARQTIGHPSPRIGDWYGAVARYSGSSEAAVALAYADDVFATIRHGAARTTSDGRRIVLEPMAVTPDRATARGLRLDRAPRDEGEADCPRGLDCEFLPAAYQQNDPENPGDYGNYDVADRERDGLDIEYIVIHDTETDYDTAIRIFQDPFSYVSTHYMIRSSDGHIAQMVRNKDVAWTAGNWYINTHSINIEHEGFAIEGATWYSERMYRASARLVRYLALKYGIPLDRGHIIGHDDVPGPTPANQSAMHWDPGPFWDWAHYMKLIGAPIRPEGGKDRNEAGIVAIDPVFKRNRPPLTYCYSADDCRDVPSQPASFVYLYTAPSFDAPLLDDPALPGPGTTRANDWGDKAATGQEFYRFARQGEWSAIYFGGQTAWFHDPRERVSSPGRGELVTPREGLSSIPVYGRAYPEAEAYAAHPEVTVQPIVPLQYVIPAGQRYVVIDRVKADYYWAKTFTSDPATHTVVEGQDEYYVIFFNHRLAFVRANDVEVLRDR